MIGHLYPDTDSIMKINQENILRFQHDLRRFNGRNVKVPKLVKILFFLFLCENLNV